MSAIQTLDEMRSFEKKCELLLHYDEVRFAGVINHKGKLIAGGMKHDIKSLQNFDKDEMLFMELSLRVRMRKEFDEEFGTVKFSISYRDKVIIMSFPIGQNVLMVSTEKNVDLNEIPFQILKIFHDD